MRKTIGHKYDIDWDAFVHAVLSGVGSAICVYLNIFAAVHMTGISGTCSCWFQWEKDDVVLLFVSLVAHEVISFFYFLQNHWDLYNVMARLLVYIG